MGAAELFLETHEVRTEPPALQPALLRASSSPGSQSYCAGLLPKQMQITDTHKHGSCRYKQIPQICTQYKYIFLCNIFLMQNWNSDDWNALHTPCRPNYELFAHSHLNRWLSNNNVSVSNRNAQFICNKSVIRQYSFFF